MSAILARPIAFAAAFSVSHSRSRTRNVDHQEPAKSLPKRLVFSGEQSCRNSVSWDISELSRKMKGVKLVHACMTDDGDQQQPFVEESPTTTEATINKLSKWVVSVIFSGLLVWRHDAEALWAALGSALNAMLALALKNILNQERPSTASTLRSDPGMPSSHAQSIVFTFAFFIISLVERFGVNAPITTLSGGLAILGFYFIWLRVSQRLHTVSQVVVGGIVGCAFTLVWFWSWKAFVLNLFVSNLFARIALTVLPILVVVGFVLHSYQGWLDHV